MALARRAREIFIRYARCDANVEDHRDSTMAAHPGWGVYFLLNGRRQEQIVGNAFETLRSMGTNALPELARMIYEMLGRGYTRLKFVSARAVSSQCAGKAM